MKATFIALLAFSLCLPAVGVDKKKLLSVDVKSRKALAEKGDACAQNINAMRYNFGVA
jgi:hypothetical protein